MSNFQISFLPRRQDGFFGTPLASKTFHLCKKTIVEWQEEDKRQNQNTAFF